MQPVHDQFSKGIVNKNIMDQIRTKGRLFPNDFLVSSNLPKSDPPLWQIFALASKMGQIKKVRTHHTEIFDQNSFQIDSIGQKISSDKKLIKIKVVGF